MTEPGLPRDDFGHPYQPCFYFDADSKPLALVIDDEGYVLGWRNTADGDPLAGESWAMDRMPELVAAAARTWMAGHAEADSGP